MSKDVVNGWLQAKLSSLGLPSYASVALVSVALEKQCPVDVVECDDFLGELKEIPICEAAFNAFLLANNIADLLKTTSSATRPIPLFPATASASSKRKEPKSKAMFNLLCLESQTTGIASKRKHSAAATRAQIDASNKLLKCVVAEAAISHCSVFEDSGVKQLFAEYTLARIFHEYGSHRQLTAKQFERCFQSFDQVISGSGTEPTHAGGEDDDDWRYFDVVFDNVYTVFNHLDVDCKGYLSKYDLLECECGYFNSRLVERLFEEHSSRQRWAPQTEMLRFGEFVTFLLSALCDRRMLSPFKKVKWWEAAMPKPASVKYLFRLVDADSDGVIELKDVESFIRAKESVQFEDAEDDFKEQSLEPLKDITPDRMILLLNRIISPRVAFRFTLSDLEAKKHACAAFFAHLFENEIPLFDY